MFTQPTKFSRNPQKNLKIIGYELTIVNLEIPREVGICQCSTKTPMKMDKPAKPSPFFLVLLHEYAVGESSKLRAFIKENEVREKRKDSGFRLIYSRADQGRPGGSRPRGDEAERERVLMLNTVPCDTISSASELILSIFELIERERERPLSEPCI